MNDNLLHQDRSFRSTLFSAGTCLFMLYAGAAQAQDADRVGVLNPASTSGGMFSGISLAVTDKLSIESFFRSNSSVSFASTGVSASLPAVAVTAQTLMGQYRFGQEQAFFRPRLGAGLTYGLSSAQRWSSLATGLHNDGLDANAGAGARSVSGVGLALEVGASYALSKSWYLEGSLMRSFVRSSGSALAAGIGGASPGLKVDPLQFSFSVGFKFQ